MKFTKLISSVALTASLLSATGCSNWIQSEEPNEYKIPNVVEYTRALTFYYAYWTFDPLGVITKGITDLNKEGHSEFSFKDAKLQTVTITPRQMLARIQKYCRVHGGEMVNINWCVDKASNLPKFYVNNLANFVIAPRTDRDFKDPNWLRIAKAMGW